MWNGLMAWKQENVRSDAVTVYALFVLLGLSSWLIPNGVFVELPYLTTELPEKWSIASYLSIVLQIANVVPLVYATVLRKLFITNNKGGGDQSDKNNTLEDEHNSSEDEEDNSLSIIRRGRTKSKTTTTTSTIDAIAVWIVLLLSFTCCVLLALYWNRVSTLFGDDKPHSLALLSIFFFAGVASTLSQVSFWPFVGRFNPVYSSAMAAGESGSGLVTSLLGVIQNPSASSSSSSSRFTLEIYFVVLAVIVFLSWFAAFFLMRLPIAKKELLSSSSTASSSPAWSSSRRRHKTKKLFKLNKTLLKESLLSREDVEEYTGNPIMVDYNTTIIVDNQCSTHHNSSTSTTTSTSLLAATAPYRVWPFYLLITWVGCLQNGVLYSILPYACLPYDNGTTVLHWAVLLSMALGPPASMIASLRYRTFEVLVVLSSVFTIGSIYITLASLSSLAGRLGPAWLVVVVQALNGFGLNYARSSVFSTIHNDLAGDDEAWRNDVLRRTGFCIQIGSAFGSLLFFVLINYTKVFM